MLLYFGLVCSLVPSLGHGGPSRSICALVLVSSPLFFSLNRASKVVELSVPSVNHASFFFPFEPTSIIDGSGHIIAGL